jgi:membrane protease YdiL (CAAX protease family)
MKLLAAARTGLPGGAALLLALLAVTAVAARGDMAAGRVVVLLLVAPLAEEIVFRAGLHEALLRRALSPHIANLATALAFGLAHLAVRGDGMAFAVVLPALLIGAVYQRTRRVRDCVLLHAAMNAFWLVAGLAGLPLFSVS